MTRVKRGMATNKKHKKILKKTKGMSHIRQASIKKAKEAVMKAESYSYRDRRTKKRTTRRLWITRLNNAVKERGLSYSKFIDMLVKNKVGLDRKILSEIAVKNPEVFDKIVAGLK
ncbi:50S ribosomal protein L20 [bacterium]|nr:50S ribosomal protein L20 [bacterium]